MEFVYLAVSGENVDLDEITRTLNITPKYSYKKGEERFNRGERIVYKEDRWIADIEINDDDKTEEEIARFIDSFYENKEYIRELSHKHCVELEITAYPDINQYHLHLSNESLGKLAELGVGIWFTCMLLEEFYTGEYVNNPQYSAYLKSKE